MPGTRRDEVKVLEYSDRLKIYQAGQCLAEYPLPADGVRNSQVQPAGSARAASPSPQSPASHRGGGKAPARLGSRGQRLSGLRPADQRPGAPPVPAPPAGLEPQDERWSCFVQTLERAHKYRITDLETLERIALLYLQQGPGQLPLVDIDAAFRERARLSGRLADRSPRLVALPGPDPIRP